MKPVAIVGKQADTIYNAPFYSPDVEIWAFNQYAVSLPRVDTYFQLHKPQAFQEWYRNWLQIRRDKPIYMFHPEGVPDGRLYPLEEALGLTRNISQGSCIPKEFRFFTSTVSYAIALAILQKRKHLMFYGFEMIGTVEYVDQRDGFNFWIGLAAGTGMDVELHCADKMYQKPLYAR